MSKGARRKPDRGKKALPSKKANTETAPAPSDQSTFMALEFGANIPPMSFESIVTTSTNFVVGAGQDIEMSGKVTHIPEPGPSRAEVQNITFGRGVDDCPACQLIRAKRLQFAESSHQALRVKVVNGWEGPLTDVSAQKDTITIANGSDYPIYKLDLIGAWLEIPGAIVVRSIYRAPENQLEGDALQVDVLQAGERYVFRGKWKWREDFILAGDIAWERRTIFAWTDSQGQEWRRVGNESPKPHPRAWSNWGNIKYADQPNIRSETEDGSKPSQ